MNKKNLAIILLVIAVVILAYLLFIKKDEAVPITVNQQTSESPSPAPTESPSPTPVPLPAPSPSPSGPDDVQVAPFNETFADSNWLLESGTLNGSKIDMSMNVPAPLTLNFDKAKKAYSGFSGCNNFSGTYKASAPDNFSFGATVSTKKYCLESSGLENNLFKAMEKVQMFQVIDGKLLLRSDDGQTKLQYKPAI